MNDDILSVNSVIPSCYTTDYSFLNTANTISTWLCNSTSGYYNYNTVSTVEKNSNELKINIKKSQIKFNFNL